MGLNTEIIEKQLAVFRNAQIKRRSALPVYLQIAEFLAQYMESADGRSDGRFPAEPDMAKAFHVSRETIRAALGNMPRQKTRNRFRFTDAPVRLAESAAEHRRGLARRLQCKMAEYAPHLSGRSQKRRVFRAILFLLHGK